jgi:SpoVK/Ycf46/Vps4 family AAA+-type ATPase
MGLEVLHKRASDLQSMWEGETEKNIANAFHE